LEKVTGSTVQRPICSESAQILRFIILAGLWLAGLPAAAQDTHNPESPHMQQLHGTAPDFMLRDASGNELHLADLRGHPVILHFWATWCAPCREELPEFDMIAREMSHSGITLVAVSIDDIADAASVQQYARDLDVRFAIYLANAGDIAESYWSWGVPVTYFIDPKGRLIARFLGPQNWASASMQTLIARFVGSAPLEGT